MERSKINTRDMLLALVLFSAKVTSLAITGAQHCQIPYIIPRAFEYKCDPIDRFVTEDMSPTTLEPGSNYTLNPSHFIAAKYMKSTPDVWTLEPWCMFSMEISKEICVYTSTAFGKNRGISIVAQVEEEMFITKAAALRDQYTYPWPDYVNPIEDTRIEKTPIPGKGIGVRAKQMLVRGDAAQSYTPVLSVQDSVMQLETKTWERNLAIKVGIQRLPAPAKKLFEDLLGQFGGDPYYDKINTNAFNAVLGDSGVFYWSVYPETSRYNHDCRPNTMYSIDSNDLLHNLRVGRTIIPGEEVTLSYLAPNLQSAERKSRMTSQWGFGCSCSLCTAPEHVRQLSDERLSLIEQLETELNDLSVNRTANVDTANLLLALYQQERLDGVIGDGYMYAAFENAYIGNKRLVQKYAALAVEHMAIWRGTGHQYYRAMWRMFVQPENEKSWHYFAVRDALLAAADQE